MGIEIVKIDSMDDLKAYVKSVTAKVRDISAAPPKEEAPLSEMAKSLLSVWDKADFGCQTVHVGQILHVLVKTATGEDIPFEREREEGEIKYGYPRLSAVVPLVKDSSHDYPIGRAFIVSTYTEGSTRQARGGICAGGRFGNDHYGAWRYATDKEIDNLFATLPDTVLTYF